MILFADLETFSDVSIRTGTGRYASSAEILLFPYAIDDAPASVWDLTTGSPIPAELAYAVVKADRWVVHNSMFDRSVLWRQMPAIAPRADQVVDTMIRALSVSLPGGLGQLCELLGVEGDTGKDRNGKKLIDLFCKPLPANRKLRRATRLTHPVEWEQFKEYARRDVEAMREVLRRLPTFNVLPFEREMFVLDQRINDRGVFVDTELAQAAMHAIEKAQSELDTRAGDLSEGELTSTRRRDALIQFLAKEYDCHLPDLQKSTVERALRADLPWPLAELLRTRLQACTTSTSKYKAVVNGVNEDGRLRNLLQFYGASRTGRWSGRTFQPQNLPRPSMPADEIERGIDALKSDCADLLFDNVMALTSNALRGLIIAPEGRKLVVADLSNIEGRVQAWLAGEEWKLQAFRDFDAGIGADLYKLAYSKSFGISPDEVTKDQRQVGKVMELALGYEGGVGAFVTFALVYGIDLDLLASTADIPQWALKKAQDDLEFAKKMKRGTQGLSSETWKICDALKVLWRDAHASIVQLWRDIKTASMAAAGRRAEGRRFHAGPLQFDRVANWLRVRLPSGRFLCYPAPKVEGDGWDAKLTYMGINQYSRKWTRLSTYSGKFFENCCQAVARDVMASAMPAIERAGYEIVLSVHDELICEAPDDPAFSPEHLSALMATPPAWASDLPLAAAGFESYRYRKD